MMNSRHKNTSVNGRRKNSILKWRVYSVLGFFVLIALTISAQLYRVQIIHGESYLKRADNQHIRPTGDIFDRGSIYFVTKDGEKINAATIKTGYKIAINPRVIEHPEDVYNNLGLLLDLDEDFYISRAEKQDDPYEEIARHVSYEDGQKIKELDIKGVSVIKENWRFYPGQELAAQTIGFTAFKDDELSGRYGLERYYDDLLDRDHSAVFKNFFAEIFSNLNDFVNNDERPSGSLVTTIEPQVQNFIESELKNTAEKWSSKKVGAIVMDPNTGAIRAISLKPDFDVNKFNLVDNPHLYSNDLVENVYEMGSIVKPLTMAIGLDTKAVNAESTYNDKGSITLNEKTFYNYDKKARGVVSMQEVLNQSLNTGVYHVVSKVGNDVFANYMKKMLETKTGIDLPNEAAPLIANLNSVNDIEYATASFGQGIAMSPISITRALATLGNGGKLVQPYLVEEIEYDLGFSKKINHDNFVQIFKPETSEEISRMLVAVVDDALRGGTVALDNYSIAAKTGTAQIANSEEGGYYEDKYLHSFFGYFPAYDPQFLVFIYNIEPNGAQYASETLTEPFMNIAKFLINHYDIKPDRSVVDTDEIVRQTQ
jgi:stage V sporulation protein D (sporulation-specific penicillin-binding protein)